MCSKAEELVADLGATETFFLRMKIDLPKIYLCQKAKGLKMSVFGFVSAIIFFLPSLPFYLSFFCSLYDC